ncbi:MAG: nucleoside recognition domain-containing protein, partial [Acetivibrionales bacterium]
MMVYTLLILIPVSVLLLLIVQPSGTIYIRLLSIPVLCIIFTACLILFTDTAAKSALNGLNLWAAVVVPSLFPFFVASEMLSRSGFARLTGKLLEPVMRPVFNVPGCSSLALALGITSGYPVGAKITSDLRKSNALTRTEAERLLAFTNNSGPLFITGAVGTGMLGSASAGMFLYICHILACI